MSLTTEQPDQTARLARPLKDVSTGPGWLKYYEKGVEQLRQKIGPDIFANGSMYLIDLKGREKALEIEVVMDSQGSETAAIKQSLPKGGESDIDFHLQIMRTSQVKFAEGIKAPNTEFILYDPKRNTFVPMASGNMYTRPNNEGVGEETPVIGIIGSTFSTRENQKQKDEGVILWMHPPFYITENYLIDPSVSNEV